MIDTEEEYEKEPKLEKEITEKHKKHAAKNMPKGVEMCKNRNECKTETVKVGVQCRKLHIEEEEFKKLKEEDREKEKELAMKKQEAKEQYCKHHLYQTCRFRDRCWKKHVTLKHYRKTIRCKFNEEGRCKNKMWCEFKHLINTPCKYYQNGNCMRGDMCNYRHIGQKENPTQEKTNEENNKPTQSEQEEPIRESEIEHENIPQQKANEETNIPQKQNFQEEEITMDRITNAINRLIISEEFKKSIIVAVKEII